VEDAPSTFVFVHGAWHDGWCWHLVARELEKAGHPVVAIDLPLAGSDGDVEAVETAISNADSPVVLVGHSYGGTVIGEAASERTDVRHLVYVCALATPIDQDGNQAMADGPKTVVGESIRIEGKHVVFDTAKAIETFYADCPTELAEQALQHLRPMGIYGLSGRRRPAYETIRSTYVVCTRDRALHPELQEQMATRCTHTVRLETDHSPFLSTPIPLARILLGLEA
jgi:pimeloyl-ACP methyl ester carboxylesterase